MGAVGQVGPGDALKLGLELLDLLLLGHRAFAPFLHRGQVPDPLGVAFQFPVELDPILPNRNGPP
jgi:hypothetical protein